MYPDECTGMLFPILIGTMMDDPSGSGQKVPILGAERKRGEFTVRPLGGTVEDPEGDGLIPIMIGQKAVDPVSGELSTINGVRVDSVSNTVVPVTVSTSGHHKRKAPLGTLSLLEEEVVARRSFWRRQRQRETELTLEEFMLAHELLFNMENITPKRVEDTLEIMEEKTHTLAECARRETQRRTEAENDVATVLPPEVVTVLTQGDEAERKCEEDHNTAHRKYNEIIGKFMAKLQDEEKRFREKMLELKDAQNPEAEHILRQRFAQARNRLRAELQDHILTKMEILDEEHSSLEYARQRNELLTLEAREVLDGSALLAGDYDCQLSGVYGEIDLSCAESDREVVPLLKQLLHGLEANQRFVLSPELLKIIQGDTHIHNNVTNIGAGGMHQTDGGGVGSGGGPGQGFGQGQGAAGRMGDGTGSGGGSGGVVRSQHVQRAPGIEPDSVEAVRATNTSVLIDPEKLRPTTAPLNKEDQKERGRQLLEKQAFEAAKTESNLRNNEVKLLSNIIHEFEEKKRGCVKDVTENLKSQLSKAKSEEDRDKLMLDYAVKLQKLTDSLEKQKQAHLDKTRQKLLERRRQMKKDLHRAHISEAKALGIPADQVPEGDLQSYDELDHDLRRLAQEQEKLLAEMQLAAAENEASGAMEWDPEMESRIRALHLEGAKEQELIDYMKKRVQDKNRKANLLKEKLKARKDRSRKKDLKSIEHLTEDEQKDIMDSHIQLSEADRLKEENALVSALHFIQKVCFFCTCFSVPVVSHYFVILNFIAPLHKIFSLQKPLKQL